MLQTGRIGFDVLDFLILNLFGPVCFGPRGRFRASDFGFTLVGFVSVRGDSFVLRISDFDPWFIGAFAR
jgi:hypothetical protein